MKQRKLDDILSHPQQFQAKEFDRGFTHSEFVAIKPITPEEYENNEGKLIIYYSFPDTKYDTVCVASTDKGICYLAFGDKKKTYSELKALFPQANFVQQTRTIHQHAIAFIQNPTTASTPITLHIKGTDFQIKVWQTLLKIPFGKITSYSAISKYIEKPNANRAVGTAVGSNPISYIIPCHRVVRSDGGLGGYHWGVDLKVAMLRWEADKIKQQ